MHTHGQAAAAAPVLREGGLARVAGCSHQGLVPRRSCRFRMTLALNTSPATVQCWAAGAGAGAGTVCTGASPHPSWGKVSSLAALGGGRR